MKIYLPIFLLVFSLSTRADCLSPFSPENKVDQQFEDFLKSDPVFFGRLETDYEKWKQGGFSTGFLIETWDAWDGTDFPVLGLYYLYRRSKTNLLKYQLLSVYQSFFYLRSLGSLSEAIEHLKKNNQTPQDGNVSPQKMSYHDSLLELGVENVHELRTLIIEHGMNYLHELITKKTGKTLEIVDIEVISHVYSHHPSPDLRNLIRSLKEKTSRNSLARHYLSVLMEDDSSRRYDLFAQSPLRKFVLGLLKRNLLLSQRVNKISSYLDTMGIYFIDQEKQEMGEFLLSVGLVEEALVLGLKIYKSNSFTDSLRSAIRAKMDEAILANTPIPVAYLKFIDRFGQPKDFIYLQRAEDGHLLVDTADRATITRYLRLMKVRFDIDL